MLYSTTTRAMKSSQLPSTSTTTTTPFDALPDDLLGNILLYCPFPSAVQFARGTSHSICRRLLLDEDNSSSSYHWHSVWKEIYHRHGFCPPAEENDKTKEFTTSASYYLELCNQKRQLLSNLMFPCKKKKTAMTAGMQKARSKRPRCHPFSLPNRYFYFLPIVPTLYDTDDTDEDNLPNMGLMMDPPPVFYECDSFVLTGCGTSPELLLLDPFDGSLRVIQDCLQHNTVASDEAMLEWAWKSAGSAICQHQRSAEEQHQNKGQRKHNATSVNSRANEEAHLAGTAIEDAIACNHYRHEQIPPPAQCLLQGDEYFDLDLSEYFPRYDNRSTTGQEEFEMNFVGTEAKPIWKGVEGGYSTTCLQLQGYMVGLGRCVTSLSNDSVVCTEVTTWTRTTTESTYGHRRLCRLPWAFHKVDMDPSHQRIFASFNARTGPDRSSKSISVYPLVDWQGGKEDVNANGSAGAVSITNFFPERLLALQFLHPVSTFILDATGQTLVGATAQGTLEVWKVSATLVPIAHRQHRLQLLEKLRSSIERELTRRTQLKSDACQTSAQRGDENDRNEIIQTSSKTIVTHSGDDEEDDDLRSNVPYRFSVLRRQLELPLFHAPVQSICLPKHLPVEQAGFVTLHHSRDDGSSLLVWKLVREKATWEVVSLIHLRLTARRRPRIVYDGNRILVLGEDHIGIIILVYQVRNLSGGGEYDADFVSDEDETLSGEASGGVYHLTAVPVVRFANRIRHVALGGIDSMDSIHMTSNERYLIVNTRAGNHLGSSPFSEGLLVIDLQDHQQ